ncbi:MAG: glycosyltransferase family 4 protein [Cyanobacteria bacterium P01_A01_bin.17]
MKILLTIHEELTVDSGAAGSTLMLGKTYEQLGHEVVYFSFSDLPEWMPLSLKDLLFPVFVAGYLLKDGAAEKFDVIDASTGDSFFWTSLFDKGEQRPVLVSRSHYLEHIEHLQCLEENRLGTLELSWYYPLYRGGINLWQVASSIRGSDLVFLLNQSEKDYLSRNLEVSPEKIHIVANGIPDQFLGLASAPLLHETNETVSIALVGTYILRKGINYSVPALNAILTRFPHVKCSFYGTQRPEVQVKKEFDPELRERINVVPHYPHASLPTLLENHQISILASNYEAFGKALIETMACGLAPIVTATAGPLEIVQDGHDALVVPLRDREAIEAALEKLLTDPAHLNQLRTHAYNTAQKYSWMQTAQERIAHYNKVRMPNPSTVDYAASRQ